MVARGSSGAAARNAVNSSIAVFGSFRPRKAMIPRKKGMSGESGATFA